MNYLVGINANMEQRMTDFIAKIDSSDEKGVEAICRELGFNEETDMTKLTLLDIMPAASKVLLGLPIEFWHKPLAEMTEEDKAMYDKILEECYTFFENTKAK